MEALGDLAEGVYSSTGWILDESIAAAAAFSSAYEAEYGAAPDWWSELGYTAAQQLMAAIEAAGTTDYAAVAPLMNDEHGFITPRGKPLRFNDKGLRLVDDWIIIQSQGGVLLPVDAVPLAG